MKLSILLALLALASAALGLLWCCSTPQQTIDGLDPAGETRVVTLDITGMT